MSHTDRCPSEWDARYEGRRASPYDENPYENEHRHRSYGDPPYCEEAARAWESGHRAAQEEREREQHEQEVQERRAQERAAEQRAEEEAYFEQQQQQHPEEPPNA